MSYSFVWTDSFSEDIRRLDPAIKNRLLRKLSGVQRNPLTFDRFKGRSNRFKVRIGNFRLVYDVDIPAASVCLILFRKRGDVYRNIYQPSRLFSHSSTPMTRHGAPSASLILSGRI